MRRLHPLAKDADSESEGRLVERAQVVKGSTPDEDARMA